MYYGSMLVASEEGRAIARLGCCWAPRIPGTPGVEIGPVKHGLNTLHDLIAERVVLRARLKKEEENHAKIAQDLYVSEKETSDLEADIAELGRAIERAIE